MNPPVKSSARDRSGILPARNLHAKRLPPDSRKNRMAGDIRQEKAAADIHQ
jgi:hypothetical protein